MGVYTPPTKLTVSKWFDIWIEEFSIDKKPLTIRNYCVIARNHIKPTIGAAKLASLTTPMIQKLYNDMQRGTHGKKQYAANTIIAVHTALHGALSQAVAVGHLKTNPATPCTLPRAEKVAITPMDDVALSAFMKATKGEEYGHIFLFDLLTGLRKAEIIGLTWDAVDLKAGKINLYRQLIQLTGGCEFGPLKNNKPRCIDLPPTAVKLLQEQRRIQNEWRMKAGPAWDNPEGFVFTKPNGEHVAHGTIYAHYGRMMKRLGLPGTRLHDLRHSHAVTALRSGVDIKTLQENLGHHSSAFTMDTYVRSIEQMKKEGANKLDTFINNLS